MTRFKGVILWGKNAKKENPGRMSDMTELKVL